MRFQTGEIHDTLLSINKSSDPAVRCKVQTLLQSLWFLSYSQASFMVWYSKSYMFREQEDTIQYHGNKYLCVNFTVMQYVQELNSFVWSFPEVCSGFQKIHQNMDFEPVAATKRLRRKKHILSCEGNENVVTDAEKSFNVNISSNIFKTPGPYLRLQTTTDKRKNFFKIYSQMGQAFSQMFNISVPDWKF